jgi:hypothetical protein
VTSPGPRGAEQRETAGQRYRREAKARLASRVGEDLAEEFFSVAQTSERDVVSTAELMAAAYKRGLGLRGQQEPAPRPRVPPHARFTDREAARRVASLPEDVRQELLEEAEDAAAAEREQQEEESSD